MVLNDGDKIPKGIDCIQNITDEDSVPAEEAGGTITDFDDDFLAVAADVAWNGKRQEKYFTDSIVQIKLNTVADMEPVSPHDF